MGNLFGRPTATARLKPRKARPFFFHHPWVFSGAIDRVNGEFDEGDLVRLSDDKGQFIATGYINTNSQIMVRLLSWDESQEITEQFFRDRIVTAKNLRETLLDLPSTTDAYRAFYGESDGLPGVIVDRYGDYLAVQIQTLGMHVRRDVVLNILNDLYKPKGIYDRSDPEMLEREGFASEGGIVSGNEQPEGAAIQSDGIKFNVNLRSGQKTGMFLDQRENRLAAAKYARGRRVLDCFCHTGGFSLYAAKLGGASKVLGLDSSEPALEQARANADANGLTNVEFRNAKLPEYLKELRESGQTFDMVVLDPPQYAKSRAGLSRAMHGYRELNAQALRLIRPGCTLVTCSCSQHLSEDDFEHLLNEAAFEAHRVLQVLDRKTQSSDHPMIISCSQTRYLKCFICHVI